mmetsp:Transcript_158108/g.303344  ORF Transcript_158108/g.303344 Transcript_158108/m.303344 type:complete len:422 (+) Transcript_158108:88-1353(+)
MTELTEDELDPHSPGTPGGAFWACDICHLLNSRRRVNCHNCHSDRPSWVDSLRSQIPPSCVSSPSSSRASVVEWFSSQQHAQLSGHASPSSADSSGLQKRAARRERKSSPERFAEPSQTIIIFDWDDTLFPTTEFFDVWGLPSRSKESMPPVSEETELGVQKWREALSDYLHRACSLSNCVAIVTSSRRPWVETCIERFVPSLRDLFMGESGKRPLVVYANEVLQRTRRLESQSMDLRPVRHREMDLSLTLEEYEEELTAAKYAAIKLIVKEFYSQYPQQSWKNVISLGDMSYEHDATQEVVFRHGTDNCRTKTIIVPTGPSLSEITLRLRFSYLMLPQYVHFDGDIDLNLQKAKDPLDAIATALNMKELANLSISRHAWGRTKAPEDGDSSTALEELAETLESLLVARRAREAGIRWPHL